MNVLASAWNWLLWPRRFDGDVTEATLRARPVFGVAASAAVVIGVVLLVLWAYRARTAAIPPRRRAVLLALRLAAAACLVPAVIDLSLRVQMIQRVKPVLAVAIDTSRSMALHDHDVTTTRPTGPTTISTSAPHDGAASTRKASDDAGSREAASSRFDRARHLLLDRGADGQSRLARLADTATVVLFAFDRGARPLPDGATAAALQPLEPDGDYTSLTATMDDVVDRVRGPACVGVLLLTDGAHNTGGSPLAAAPRWRQADVPVFAVGVGDPNPRDVEVHQVLADEMLFAGEASTVIVRLRYRGYAGQPVRVFVRSGTDELGRADAVLAGDTGEMNVSVSFTPREAGEHTFRVEVPPLPDELSEQNNHRSFVARVTSERIRVLYVEGRPRWQYRFLRDAMTRDRQLRPAILLVGAEQTADAAPPFIASLPSTKAGFEEYDLVILGDVDAAVMTSDQMTWIADLVRDGGAGLLVLAGPSFTPRVYVDTPLADLLPVEPAEEAGRAPVRPRAGEEDRFVPQLTPLGRSHPALQLGDDAESNRREWETLPGVFWFAPVRRARPGAWVLAVHPHETADDAPLPLMAVQQVGRGRVFYCGIDETWRWRYRQGDRIFYRLWGQVINYLGAAHLAGTTQRIQLQTDRATYARGETALVTVRAEDLPAGEMPVVVAEREDGRQERLTLAPSPGAEHLYEGRLPLAAAGLWRLWIEGQPSTAAAVIEVEAPQLEWQEPAANLALLSELANATGGRFVTPSELDGLLNGLDFSPRRVEEQHDCPLWDRPLLVLVFVGLLAAEWIGRRVWQLP